MNYMQTLNILVFFAYIVLLISLFIEVRRFDYTKILFLFIFGFILWSLFSYKFYNNKNSLKEATIYLNLASIGWIYLSSIFLYFIVVFTKRYDYVRSKIFNLGVIGIPLLFLYAQWLGYLAVPQYVESFTWKSVWMRDNLVVYFFFFYSLILNIISFYLGIDFIKRTKNSLRVKQGKIIIYSSMIIFVIVFMSEILLQIVFPKLNVTQIGSISGLPWGILLTYSITKYKSLDFSSEILKKNVLNIMFDPVILLNSELKIISANKAVFKVFGYNEDELLNNTLCVLREDTTDYLPISEQIDLNHEFINIETVFKTKGGKSVDVLISTSVVKDDNSDLDGVVCVIRDITDNNKKNKIKDVLLKISEYSLVFDDLTDFSIKVYRQISLLMDTSNFYIALIHDTQRGIYTFPYIVDENPDEYVEPGVPVSLKDGLTHFVFNRKKPILVDENVSETIYKKYGVKIIGKSAHSWLGVPLMVSNEKVLGVIVLQSYNENKKYSKEDLDVLVIISNTIANAIEHWQHDESLIQLEKMEVVGKLAGGVAHDLNNVLGAMVSYPDLVLKKLPKDSPLVKTVTTIKQSGLRAAAIVQDLLTLARRGVAINSVVNLNDIIIDYMNSPVFEKLKSYHPDIDIETKLFDNIPFIKGSALHLSKTIMNLVSNAAESIKDSGKVKISTEFITIEEEYKGYYHTIKAGNYVLLKIADSGSGIALTDLNKIFEPFYTKKTMGRSGTGLGMAVVWGAIEDHKGFIDVKSKEGQGTVFELFFPITDKVVTKIKEKSKLIDFSGNGEKILIIDDLLTQREIAKSLLLELGYSVHSVSSGEEGIEFLKNSDVNLCIIDMIMEQGLDGLDTYREIRKIKPDLKVIIASGYSESERVKEAMKLGVKAYIPKPYTLKNIGLVVKQILTL